MEPIVFVLVAGSAVLHVAWNVLLKTAGEPLRAATVGMSTAALVIIPAAIVGWLLIGRPPVPPEAIALGVAMLLWWPFGVYGATALEAIAVGILFVWLTTLVRTLAALVPQESRPSRSPAPLRRAWCWGSSALGPWTPSSRPQRPPSRRPASTPWTSDRSRAVPTS